MKRGLGVLLIFVVINIVVVGGQKLAHLEETSRLNEIRQILDNELPQIETEEAELRVEAEELHQTDIRLSELESEIKIIESKYPNGIPPARYQTYVASVDEFNSLLGSYKNAVRAYSSDRAYHVERVNRYNTLVEEANALSDKIGGTWYMIPRGNPFR